MSKVLELKNVTKTLGKRKVVDNVSFDVNEGEIFGFLGPNGAGKTTTIKMIVGLLSIDEGEIHINGTGLKKDFEKAMSTVGGIIENPELYEYMTGRQNLKVFGRMNGDFPKERYEEIIAQVKLSNRIDEKVKKYSLGMRQRLGVAQALLHSPKLLVLDEPTNGLDPAGIRELRNTLKECAEKEGLAVLVSSHLLSEMELMCDRFGIIDKGVLTDIKSLKDIRLGTTNEKRAYAFDVDMPQRALELLKKRLGEEEIKIVDKQICLTVSKEEAANLNALLVGADIKVYAIAQTAHTLEDEFMAATTASTQIH